LDPPGYYEESPGQSCGASSGKPGAGPYPGTGDHHYDATVLHPGAAGLHSVFAGLSWDQVERAYVRYLLEKNRWHITRAAKEAGVNRSTFDSRMKRLGIRK
jgi:transcriptional regulator of acetoin/glycerol metabolism